MAMTYERFERVVHRLERMARQNPTGYKLRILLLGALGYAYIFLMLSLAGGLLGGLLWLVLHEPMLIVRAWRVVLPVGGSVGWSCVIVLSSLRVGLPPPVGTVLHREQAVPLFQLVDRLRTGLKAPRFHEVLLVNEFNCGVMQRPRLGVLGWQKNYLLIGLPLMLALSPEQFRAVLAHEIGHVSAAHGRFGAWVYRLHMTWEQLLDGFEQQEHSGALAFLWFFNWYVPVFAAYSFALRRANEYEADRAAAQAAGARQAADMLINCELMTAFLHDSSGPVAVPAGGAARVPPFHAYAEAAQLRSWLSQALSFPADVTDTHPSLADRLRALRQDPRIPEPTRESAAEHLLEHKLMTVAGHLAGAPEL